MKFTHLAVVVLLVFNSLLGYARVKDNSSPLAKIYWDSKSDIGFLTDSTLNFKIINQFNQRISYQLVAHAMAMGDLVTMPLVDTDHLSMGESGVLTLSLEKLEQLFVGHDLNTMHFSGNLYLEATLSDHNGVTLQRAYSPTVFFHKETGYERELKNPLYKYMTTEPDLKGHFFSYAREFRDAELGYGNLYGKSFYLPTEYQNAQLQGVIHGGNGLAENPDRQAAFDGNVVIGDETIPNELKVCFSYDFQTIDSGGGEDYYWGGNKMVAHGVYVIAYHQGWQGYYRFLYAEPSSGCIRFEAPAFNGDKDYTFFILGHNKVGGYGDDQAQVLLNGFAGGEDYKNNGLAYWIIDDFDPGQTYGQVFLSIEPSDIGNLIAGAVYTAWRIDLLSRLSSNHEMALNSITTNEYVDSVNLVVEDEYPDSNAYYCNYYCGYSFDEDIPEEKVAQRVIYAPVEKSKYKFVIAHEIGHFIQNSLGALITDLSYSVNEVLSPSCSYSGAHSMFSLEWHTGAWFEGFAYFISALAWNSHFEENGVVRYFKSIEVPSLDLADFNYGLYLNIPEKNWSNNVCHKEIEDNGGNADDNANGIMHGKAVEYDWMRFYWSYLTANVLAEDEEDVNDLNVKPTVAQIFQQLGALSTLYPYYFDYEDWKKSIFATIRATTHQNCLDQQGQAMRWNFLGQLYGVESSFSLAPDGLIANQCDY